jgi:hypothetical protein
MIAQNITLSAHVERLYRDHDIREVVEIIERERGPMEDPEREARRRRSIIEMCSRLRSHGTLSQAKPPPGIPKPAYVQLDPETRDYFDLGAAERKMIFHECLRRVLVWIADEDLLPLCPTLNPIGGM